MSNLSRKTTFALEARVKRQKSRKEALEQVQVALRTTAGLPALPEPYKRRIIKRTGDRRKGYKFFEKIEGRFRELVTA